MAWDFHEVKICVLWAFSLKNLTVTNSMFVYFIGFHLDMKYLLISQACAFVQHLYKSFQEEQGLFQFATAITSNDLEEIQKFLDGAVDSR